MPAPLTAAAYSRGASRCSAATAQKSPPSTPLRSSSPAAASRHATSSAPSQVLAPCNGDQVCERAPERPNGSNTNTSPSARRRAIVARSRSVLIELATAGPAHSSSAGIAMPADLPDCGGPNATSAWRCSAYNSRRSAPPEHEAATPARARAAAQRAQLAGPCPAGSSVLSAGEPGRQRAARPRGDQGEHPTGAGEDRQRCVEPEGAGQLRADDHGPRAGRVRQSRRQPDEHREQLPDAHRRPARAEQRAGQAAPQPQRSGHAGETADRGQHCDVGASVHPRPSFASVTRMPVSVFVNFASSRDR